MKGFFKSSIGKKLLMSLSGLFLITFLLVHMGLNLTMLFDKTGDIYNQAAHFMATNPIVKVMEPILGLGFLVHILYGFIVQFNNWKARGNSKYAVVNQKESSTWASRNMIWLGVFVLSFLVLHIINFYVKIKMPEISEGIVVDTIVNNEEMHNTYSLVTTLFQQWWYVLIYLISFIALGLHLHHAFWSAFQTIGLNNKNWQRRLEVIGDIYTIIIVIGFSIIPIYFFIFN